MSGRVRKSGAIGGQIGPNGTPINSIWQLPIFRTYAHTTLRVCSRFASPNMKHKASVNLIDSLVLAPANRWYGLKFVNVDNPIYFYEQIPSFENGTLTWVVRYPLHLFQCINFTGCRYRIRIIMMQQWRALLMSMPMGRSPEHVELTSWVLESIFGIRVFILLSLLGFKWIFD